MPETTLLKKIIQVIKTDCSLSLTNNVDQLVRIEQKIESLIADHLSVQEVMTDSREVTILLSDLRGFTALSEHYPATDVMELLNRYFARMSEIIVIQHKGTIDKFMGDGIMVLFGAPEENNDDLQRALSCAIHMQIAMDEINNKNQHLGMPNLFMGIGINTGRVVAGKLGSELHSEYTVIGDEVNLASRIEAYSLRGQVLISENCYQKAKEYITTGTSNQVFVKGKKEPVKLYELLSLNSEPELRVPCREVRKNLRIEVDLPLIFYMIDDKTVLQKEYSASIIDLSYSGMLIELEQELKMLSEIKFSLSLSLMNNQSSDIYGKVIRANKVMNAWHVNIEFTSIPTDADKALRSYINRIIQGM